MRIIAFIIVLFCSCSHGQEMHYEYLFDKNFKGETLILDELPDGRLFGEKTIKIGKASSSFYIEYEVCKSLNSSTWSVEVIDENGATISTLNELSSKCQKFELGPVEQAYLTIKAKFDSNDPVAKVEVKNILVKNIEVSPKSYQNPDSPNIENIDNDDDIFYFSTGVAKLSIVNDIGRYSCTAFLIDKDLLLTNLHCITKETRCENIKIDFTYYYFQLSKVEEGITCKEINLGSYALDWSTIKLSAPQSNKFIFKSYIGNVKTKESLTMIHHPEGLPKKVTRSNCKIVDIAVKGNSKEFLGEPFDFHQDLSHTCDTASGSSV